MATIVTVHGTFAHMATGADDSTGTEKPSQTGTSAASASDAASTTSEPSSAGTKAKVEPVDRWWADDSTFANEIRSELAGADGPVKVDPFVWSGDNSETDRRRAGRKLFRKLQDLDAAGERYCLIGHSHGGSVISHALLFSAARKKPLTGLQKWLTVGTPFVHLRKERFLFLRLSLFWKAVFIASLMLLFMFLFFVIGTAADGQVEVSRTRQLIRIGIAATLTAIPFALFYAFATFIDSRKLYSYSRGTRKRARALYADKWLALTHEDDEAVNGLGSLRTSTPSIFHASFATPAFSLFSAFVLPMLYLYLVFSPTTMVWIAETLRDNVYAMEDYETKRTKLTADQQELRSLRRALRREREKLDEVSGVDLAAQLEAEAQIRTYRSMIADEREKLVQRFEDLPQIKRVSRFRRRFLTKNGQPCEGDTLCGQGHDVILNSRLLFHLVTDEVSSAIVDEEYRTGIVGNLVRFLIPILLVPIVFGAFAILIVYLTQSAAYVISSGLAKIFDRLTWFEVKRSAMGNDTETEVALRTESHPDWIETAAPALPKSLSKRLTDHANAIAARSLSKFRNAISEIVVADEKNKAANILSFLTWQELIHTSYFEVPEFKALITEAIATSEGFQPAGGKRPGSAREWATAWLADRSAVSENASGPDLTAQG